MSDKQESTATPGAEDGVQVQQGTGALTATVSTEEIESGSAEQENTEGLILGKFKSHADLETAYAELEKKMSSGQTVEGEPGEAPTEGEGEGQSSEDGTEEATSNEDRYGKVVTDALDAAGIKVADVDAELEADGKFSDKTREALTAAGFPLVLVEAAERGMTQSASSTKEIGEAQITEIKQIAGGDEGFGKVQEWIAKSYTPEQLQGYNDAIDTGDVAKAKAAVQAAVDAYRKEFGSEGKRQEGRAADQKGPGYSSEAEYLEAMADPRYKTSAAFRNEVTQKLANSPAVFVTR